MKVFYCVQAFVTFLLALCLVSCANTSSPATSISSPQIWLSQGSQPPRLLALRDQFALERDQFISLRAASSPTPVSYQVSTECDNLRLKLHLNTEIGSHQLVPLSHLLPESVFLLAQRKQNLPIECHIQIAATSSTGTKILWPEFFVLLFESSSILQKQ